MFKLTKAFQAWIDYKMDTDPFWQQNARVVFSGPDVPGEGEHKVTVPSVKKIIVRNGKAEAGWKLVFKYFHSS